jgi:hypothetical protein
MAVFRGAHHETGGPTGSKFIVPGGAHFGLFRKSNVPDTEPSFLGHPLDPPVFAGRIFRTSMSVLPQRQNPERFQSA